MAEDDVLILTPDRLALAIAPDRSVMVMVDLGASAQFVGRPLGLSMSPNEARAFAHALTKKADEAEGRTPR